MISYFKELLETLKRIERHLSLLASCVREGHHPHGDRFFLSTKHWND